MNINKKLDRVKQWAGEKMGGETKTCVSDDFKNLEVEMALRHEGMDKLHKSMTVYVKYLSKRSETDDKEKVLPVAYLGQTMSRHGEDFEPDSEFGNCLIGIGRTNERLSRIQEGYVSHATSGWLESCDRSLAQMKEYQAARKKLENRRLAYDASMSKMQKAKKEDFRVEEELRSQKAKYEESSEDVMRRMQDIKEAEADSIADLGAFLEAELEYHDRCRDELLRLKREWPAGNCTALSHSPRSGNRSRSSTLHSLKERNAAYEDPISEAEPARPAIRSNARVQSSSRLESHYQQDDYGSPSTDSPPRPAFPRAATFQGPTSTSTNRDAPPPLPSHPYRKSSVPSDVNLLRANLRPTASRINTGSTPTTTTNNNAADLFADHASDDSTLNSTSPDAAYDYGCRSGGGGERSVSPATSQGSSVASSARKNGGYYSASGYAVNPSTTTTGSSSSGYANVSAAGGTGMKKPPPPPPPPSRAKKPPPPPPMKRSEFAGAR